MTHPDDARHCEILMMSKAPLLLGFESGPTLVAFLLLKPERDIKALFIIGLKSLSKTMQRNLASGVESCSLSSESRVGDCVHRVIKYLDKL